ncbi:DUF262 domain-containing protein [Citrobacter braakii]|uniref:DUF262 domain-containing protein n=1 Tax=Citrobacter braakii TaxID=57706 RepID=UPI00242A61AC|nr:DUF262 domain-containing protein [Citrobacter braakii]WFZ49913.1 DUF262 domain-containing protein [Citrobacter braakii]
MSSFNLDLETSEIIVKDDIFVEDDGFSENGEDNRWTEQQKREVGNAVVFSTDWTTETIINQIHKGNIELNPNFQRRDAWTSKEKSRFIESLMLGFPIPPIVLAVNNLDRGKYIVLDGKQRLLSLYSFFSNDRERVPPLKLTGLKVKDEFNNLTFEKMQSLPECTHDIAFLENQPIRTIVIKNYPHESFLYEVFLRLNTGSKPLSPQELRQALHPGSFTSYLDVRAANSNVLKDILNRKTPDFRMRDVELLLRELSYVFFLKEYDGDLKSFLDNTCKTLNKNWESIRNKVEEYCDEFEKAHEFTKSIFGKDAYRKYLKGEFVNRFNRGILDSMAFYFVESDVRDYLKDKKNNVYNAFIELCKTDSLYMDAIESTTKTIPATRYRIVRWGSVLKDLGAPVNIPELDER